MRLFWMRPHHCEDLIAAVLNICPQYVDQNSGADGGDDIDSVELVEGEAGAVNVAAVKTENIQSLVGADEIELVEHHFAGSVFRQSVPKRRSAF